MENNFCNFKSAMSPDTSNGRQFHIIKMMLLIVIFFVYAFCQDQVQLQASVTDLQKELASWQQKIKDIESRIAKTDAAKADQVNAFRSYLRAEAVHKAQFQAQNDSLESDIKKAEKRVDSLEQTVGSRKMGGEAADNQVEEMRLVLITSCEDLRKLYDSLPPSNIRAASATLDFLKSELESKTVTVSEALERYYQILSSLDDAESSMETYTGVSPVQEITGQAYFIRIGLVYLAVTSEEGKEAYIWVPVRGYEGSWQPVNDVNAKAALWDAVRIRDHKIVPDIVNLPFDHYVTVQGVDESGREKHGGDQ
jgi:hypothetical protein